MQILVQAGLIAMLFKKHAAASNDADTRALMEVSRDLAVPLINNTINNRCVICTDRMVCTADDGSIDDNACSRLTRCFYSPKHVFHTECLVRVLSRSFSCPLCNANLTNLYRNELLGTTAGCRAFRERQLRALECHSTGVAKCFFKSLRLFPAEFDAMRQKICEWSAAAADTLDQIWHIQLGIPHLEQYFLDKGVDTPQPYAFYYSFREYINSDAPAVSRGIEFIKAAFDKYDGNDNAKADYAAAIAEATMDVLACRMDENDIYTIMIELVKNQQEGSLIKLIQKGRFIRSISTEKIIRLIECSVEYNRLVYRVFWAVWVLAGAGRSFGPEDSQAIVGCIDRILDVVIRDGAFDILRDIKAMVEANTGESAGALAWLVNYKHETDVDIIRKELAENGAVGLLASASREKFTQIFRRMNNACCRLEILREVYFMVPNALRSREISKAIVRRLIQEKPVDEAMAFLKFIPQEERFGLRDIIELFGLVKYAEELNSMVVYARLVTSSIETIRRRLKESEADCALLYKFFQRIDFHWGILLFGDCFGHYHDYVFSSLGHARDIIFLSSHLLELVCQEIPLRYGESPLLRLLSRKISSFIEKAACAFSDNRFYDSDDSDSDDSDDKAEFAEYVNNHSLIYILGSPFFRNSVSDEDVSAFCRGKIAEMDANAAGIQGVCIFFNIISDKKQENIMKVHIYQRLSMCKPRGDVVRSLAGIGFRFFETADNEWAYEVRCGRKRRHLRLGEIDSAVSAMIGEADKYQLLAILREKRLNDEAASG